MSDELRRTDLLITHHSSLITHHTSLPMRLFHGTDNSKIARPTVLTLGVFDGLHLGHQLIMKTVVERARATGAVPTVITFEPHPRALLRQVIVDRLHAKEVYLGCGFAFGHGREGNIDLLRTVSKSLGFFADEVPELRLRGRRVSSSRIRELLQEGKVNITRRMLGRPYGVEGRVVRGAERGATLGFPTANLHPQNRVIPRGGVYVTATLIDGQWRRSVTNIGTRPTFESGAGSSVETFIMNWSGDLYGDGVRVRFVHRLAYERKFNSVDELKVQIRSDVARAEEYFGRAGVKKELSIV